MARLGGSLQASSPLLRFVVRRLAAVVMLGVGITLVAFILVQLVPADPADANLGQRARSDPAAVRAFRERYGLDRPVPLQYAIYLGHLLHGDMGESQQSRRPVRDDLAEFVPATAEIALSAMLLAFAVGTMFGLVAALNRDRLVDHALRIVSLAGLSMPTFWLALVGFYVFFYKLSLLPGSGRLDPDLLPPPHVTGLYTVDGLLAGTPNITVNALQHMVLPVLVLAAPNIGLLTRFARASVLDVIESDYVRAARAKGIPEHVVTLRHVMRAAISPVVTVAGIALAQALAGTVLVENIFSWPGLGQYAYRSATTLDLPAIMGVAIFIAALYVLANLAVDLLHAAIDPRLRVA